GRASGRRAFDPGLRSPLRRLGRGGARSRALPIARIVLASLARASAAGAATCRRGGALRRRCVSPPRRAQRQHLSQGWPGAARGLEPRLPCQPADRSRRLASEPARRGRPRAVGPALRPGRAGCVDRRVFRGACGPAAPRDGRPVAHRAPASAARGRAPLGSERARADPTRLTKMIRRGGPQDVPFLRDMLRHAYYARWGQADDEGVPLSRYVEGWGRRGDAAMIEIEGFMPVGAAWYRLFTASRPGYGFADDQTPELTIAVVPSCRGRGYGQALLEALLARASSEGYSSASLSVEPDNPALHLYERFGFEPVGER